MEEHGVSWGDDFLGACGWDKRADVGEEAGAVGGGGIFGLEFEESVGDVAGGVFLKFGNGGGHGGGGRGG